MSIKENVMAYITSKFIKLRLKVTCEHNKGMESKTFQSCAFYLNASRSLNLSVSVRTRAVVK